MEGMCENGEKGSGEKGSGEKENKGMMVTGTGANAFLWRRRDGEKKRTLRWVNRIPYIS